MASAKNPSENQGEEQPLSIAAQLRGIAKSTLSKKPEKRILAMMYHDKYGI